MNCRNHTDSECTCPKTTDRKILLHCHLCKIDQEEIVEFGHFLDINPGCRVEVMFERPGICDTPVRPVVCTRCGCTQGLRVKSDVKITRI